MAKDRKITKEIKESILLGKMEYANKKDKEAFLRICRSIYNELPLHQHDKREDVNEWLKFFNVARHIVEGD